jgi:hypothetical protein
MARWTRAAGLAISVLIYGLAALWCVLVFINSGEFRKYIATNALLLCSLSLGLSLTRFLYRGHPIWITATFKRWFVFWLTLGLGLPIVLFVADRLLPYSIPEPLLFSLWPSNAMLLIPGISWKELPVLMAISMTVNAAVYTGLSRIVWSSVTHFLASNSKQSPELRVDR